MIKTPQKAGLEGTYLNIIMSLGAGGQGRCNPPLDNHTVTSTGQVNRGWRFQSNYMSYEPPLGGLIEAGTVG